MSNWDQAELQRHIDDGVEESLNLDYKAAGALDKDDKKKEEITKDVSAMANSAGGIIIYGIKEHSAKDKKHLPEKITPIDRMQFSKEWLGQIINSIQPRITGIIIHPVSLNTGINDVAYVVEIPQSTTAHQARDFRYYRRYNFECVPMTDYEVRDVMYRRILPDVTVEFGTERMQQHARYRLTAKIKNQGNIAVDKYKLQFRFNVYDNEEAFAVNESDVKCRQGSCDVFVNKIGKYVDSYDVAFWSKEVLFPKDEVELTELFRITYYLDNHALAKLREDKTKGVEKMLGWALYADDMPPKTGEIPFSTLHNL
jgi:hypothetical protein